MESAFDAVAEHSDDHAHGNGHHRILVSQSGPWFCSPGLLCPGKSDVDPVPFCPPFIRSCCLWFRMIASSLTTLSDPSPLPLHGWMSIGCLRLRLCAIPLSHLPRYFGLLKRRNKGGGRSGWRNLCGMQSHRLSAHL